MLLGSKPLSAMSDDELLAAIEELRSNREALRTEAIAKKKTMAAIAKSKEPAKPDDDMAAIYKLLTGGI